MIPGDRDRLSNEIFSVRWIRAGPERQAGKNVPPKMLVFILNELVDAQPVTVDFREPEGL